MEKEEATFLEGWLRKHTWRKTDPFIVQVTNHVSQVTDTCGQLYEKQNTAPRNLFLWDHSWSGRRIWIESLISTDWLFTSLMEFSFLDVLTAVVYRRAACFCRALRFLFITGETLRKHICNGIFSSPLHCVKSFRGHMFCSSCGDIWGWIAE